MLQVNEAVVERGTSSHDSTCGGISSGSLGLRYDGETVDWLWCHHTGPVTQPRKDCPPPSPVEPRPILTNDEILKVVAELWEVRGHIVYALLISITPSARIQAWKKSSSCHESWADNEHGLRPRPTSADYDNPDGAARPEDALYHATIDQVVSVL